MCRNVAGVHVYRGIAEHVITGSSVEDVQRRLSELVPEPNPMDDDLTIWEPGQDGEWQQVSSYCYDEMEWV